MIAKIAYVAAAVYCLVTPTRYVLADGTVELNVYPFGLFSFISLLLGVFMQAIGRVERLDVTAGVSWFVTVVCLSLPVQMWLMNAFGFVPMKSVEMIVVLVSSVTLVSVAVRSIRQDVPPRRLWLVVAGTGIFLLGASLVWLALHALGAVLQPNGAGTIEELASHATRFYFALLASASVLVVGTARGLWVERKGFRPGAV
jgi:hypothetical protein